MLRLVLPICLSILLYSYVPAAPQEEVDKGVKHPDTPKASADPKELEAMPEGDDAMILNFHGHPWSAMIEWYSMASGREIEWRELPTGYVNLCTTRKYSMAETADLLNRLLLLARGYTILDDGELMVVEKTESINSALVPRVNPSALATLMPHSFVRTSFRLTRVLTRLLRKCTLSESRPRRRCGLFRLLASQLHTGAYD